MRSLTTGVLLGTCSVSFLSSAVACDPAPSPPICGAREPTAYAGLLSEGTVELVVVIDQSSGGSFNPAVFDPIAPDHVEGATIAEVGGYDYARFVLVLDEGATTVRLRAKLRCWPSPEEDEEQDLPSYEIVVQLGETPTPGDPLEVSIEEIGSPTGP
ncbi:MAG: hypothetical protein U0414_42125 [Polyangiaceae bacterium]